MKGEQFKTWWKSDTASARICRTFVQVFVPDLVVAVPILLSNLNNKEEIVTTLMPILSTALAAVMNIDFTSTVPGDVLENLDKLDIIEADVTEEGDSREP